MGVRGRPGRVFQAGEASCAPGWALCRLSLLILNCFAEEGGRRLVLGCGGGCFPPLCFPPALLSSSLSDLQVLVPKARFRLGNLLSTGDRMAARASFGSKEKPASLSSQWYFILVTDPKDGD